MSFPSPIALRGPCAYALMPFVCLLPATGNKVLAFFDVVSWGYGAYVTLEVTAPSGKQLQSFVSESEGRVDFVAAEDGEYNFCFKNAYSETELSFWINTETDIGLSDVAKEGTLTRSSQGVSRGAGRRPVGTADARRAGRSSALWRGWEGAGRRRARGGRGMRPPSLHPISGSRG